MSYAEKIAGLVKMHIDDGRPEKDITPLLVALGCRSMFEMPDNKVRSLQSTEIEDEALVLQTLLRILQWSLQAQEPSEETCQAVLHGLSINERWRACFAGDELSYELATTIIHLTGVVERTRHMVSPFLHVWLAEANNTIHYLVDAWLGKAQPINAPLTLDGLLATFFGEVSTQLMWRNKAVEPELVAGVIMTIRPPFAPGVLGRSVADLAIGLSPLEMP